MNLILNDIDSSLTDHHYELAIDKIRAIFEKYQGVSVYSYGKRQMPRSDIDLLVIVDDDISVELINEIVSCQKRFLSMNLGYFFNHGLRIFPRTQFKYFHYVHPQLSEDRFRHICGPHVSFPDTVPSPAFVCMAHFLNTCLDLQNLNRFKSVRKFLSGSVKIKARLDWLQSCQFKSILHRVESAQKELSIIESLTKGFVFYRPRDAEVLRTALFELFAELQNLVLLVADNELAVFFSGRSVRSEIIPTLRKCFLYSRSLKIPADREALLAKTFGDQNGVIKALATRNDVYTYLHAWSLSKKIEACPTLMSTEWTTPVADESLSDVNWATSVSRRAWTFLKSKTFDKSFYSPAPLRRDLLFRLFNKTYRYPVLSSFIRNLKAKIVRVTEGKKKVIVRIDCGLGNQMFQYALGRKLSVLFRANLILDISSFHRDPYVYANRKFELGGFRIAATAIHKYRYHHLNSSFKQTFLEKVLSKIERKFMRIEKKLKLCER